MLQLKKIFATAALAVVAVAAANAQTTTEEKDYKPFPHMFVSVQGGMQTTFTNNYNNANLITPTASLGFGAWFTPVVGARIHENGIWNKGGVKGKDGFKYDYKYSTTNLDLMINLMNLFGKKESYPVYVYLIGGVGLNYAWGNDDAFAHKDVLPFAWEKNRVGHNARIGAQAEVNINKYLGLNLEVAANSLSDRYNSKMTNKDDWQLTAQLGVAYKFGYKKNVKEPEPEPEEIWETRIDTTWYDDVTYTEETRTGDIKKEIFFAIRESDVVDPAAQQQIAAVAEFLKTVTEGGVIITAYADKGTGTPKLNMKYSKQRAEKTHQAFLDLGVSPEVIKSVEWKGDTEQPYAENDKNRLVIITGYGTYTEKIKHVEKKFRTKEVRYRVQ